MKDATRDPDEIRRILAGRTAYGMTPPRGVLLFDVDGAAIGTWERLEAAHGLAPDSWSQTTKNGRHVGYLWPVGGPADPGGNLAGIVTRRGGTGYVVGPFSEIGGHVYRPDLGSDDVPRAFAELPVAYAEAFATARQRDPTTTRGLQSSDCLACGTLPEKVEGSRYGAILSLTMRLHMKGHGDDVKWIHIRDHLAPRFTDALTEPEVRSRFDRATADHSRMDQRARAWEAERRAGDGQVAGGDASLEDAPPLIWPEPEDRGSATPSLLGGVEYVEDLVRPGRIVVWAAEEGSGKSYAVDDELGIRVAVAGGSFAGTWKVLQTGPVVYLSEMHADDDFDRETTVLESLGVERSALTGRLYRLPLMTAAGGRPALTVPQWCTWMTGWLRDHEALLLIIDTATAASQVDPWGQEIQAVFSQLRRMQADYPALAIILVVHVKKPAGRGDRRISDVLGEWGRWCDVVVMQENDGANLERAKITARKRLRRERRIVAKKVGGLLIDPVDATAASGPKVPVAAVIAAVTAKQGLTLAELGQALGVSKDTANRYVQQLSTDLDTSPTGPRGAIRVFLTAAPPQATAQGSTAVPAADISADRRTAARTYIGAAVRAAVPLRSPEAPAGHLEGQR